MTVNRSKLPVTETNFTLLLVGGNAALKTVANGGSLQNTSGYDLCPSDASNATVYAWRLLSYSATTGDITLRILVPSVAGAGAGSDTAFKLWYGKSGQSAPTGEQE